MKRSMIVLWRMLWFVPYAMAWTLAHLLAWLMYGPQGTPIGETRVIPVEAGLRSTPLHMHGRRGA